MAALKHEEEQHTTIPLGGGGAPGSGGGQRRLRAAAAKAIDRGKRVAEMILECNEDGEHGGGDDGERDEEDEGEEDGVGGGGVVRVGDEMYRRKPIKTRWSAAEDSTLKQLVDVHGSGNWRVVSGGVVEVVCCFGRAGQARLCHIQFVRLFWW